MKRLITCIATTALTTAAIVLSAQSSTVLAAGHPLTPKMPVLSQAKNLPPSGNSIAGLWHTVNTLPDGSFFLEAYTMWRSDGTFEELANRPPATGSISMGTWTQDGNTITLPLAVSWLYDTSNNFAGTLNLNETYTVKEHGKRLSGTFDAKFYDPKGNLMQEVTGPSKASRLN